ncbi:MAG: UDP-GlcNAc3NAcA epimerase [Tenuifilum sp.]|nr:UDP-GlcNAc3NAcA epimerase [Tenuifilum sp.]
MRLQKMSKKATLTVLGARPQFIKAAAVSRQLQKFEIPEIIVHTGQHFDKNMSDVFFKEMSIPLPQYNLKINSLSHGAMTGRMLEQLEEIILKETPSAVMVYGDTNSTLAGALAAVKQHVRVIHVEAGLRSFNMAMPEEVNRILTDRISNLLFCPTDTAVKNLKNEGYENFNAQIVKSGDVMQDAAYFYLDKAKSSSKIIERLGLTSDFILATIHRQENTDDPSKLKQIIDGLNRINNEVRVVVPLHPRTQKILKSTSISTDFTIIEPVGYFDMLMLISNSKMVMTDSGGLQKEAFFFGKHCITLREQTEWVELVENGFNRLAGSSSDAILNAFHEMSSKESNFNIDLYGNGKASENIAQHLKNWL